jgi:hypothetical protein
MEVFGSGELTIPRRLEAWIAEYEAKLAAVPEALAAFENACATIRLAACVGGTWGEQTIDTGRGISASTMERSIRVSAWRHFISDLRLDAIMSAADKKRVDQMLADPLPFDRESIRAVLGDHIADPRNAILRGLAEVFTGLDPAYKSHEKVKIGVKGLPKRVVIYGFGGFIGNRYHHGGRDKVRDILNALAAYQRKPLVTNAELAALDQDGDALKDAREVLDPHESEHVHRRRAERGEPPKKIRTVGRGVWLKTFQNGNGHLFFAPDALRDINLALAEFYGDVLPDCPDADEDRPAPRHVGTAVSKDLQFYPTPQSVIDGIVAELGDIRGKRVLEPSCGDGRIMDALRAKGARVCGVEVDPARAERAKEKGHAAYCGNFLEVQPGALGLWGDFDMVVMNPPFYGRHYSKHVRHALRFLKPGGKLVAILPATARYDHGLLDDLAPDWRDLPVGAFAESGTNVCTTIAKIRKQKEARNV